MPYLPFKSVPQIALNQFGARQIGDDVKESKFMKWTAFAKQTQQLRNTKTEAHGHNRHRPKRFSKLSNELLAR